MAEITKRRRHRMAKRQELIRRMAVQVRNPLRRRSGDDDPDLDGGAGVREPRRPDPTHPAGAVELRYAAESTHLDLTR